MLQTQDLPPDPEALSVNLIEKKISAIDRKMSKSKGANGADHAAESSTATGSSSSNTIEWEEVKKARNRINSQRTRERERAQIKNLEAERARLWLSNDAIKFQNRHFKETIARILEVRDLKRSRVSSNGGMGISGPGSSSANGTSKVLVASLGAAGTLGGGSSMQMPLSMRHNTDVMNSLGGGLDGTLFQSSRLSASAKNLSGLSDADLLARHQATTLEMQNLMRQQEAMDRFGAGGGVGMGSLNMSLNGRMGGGSTGGGGGPSARGINLNGMNGMNMNGMNMNGVTASPYADMADNIRIRQLMLQHSAAAGDFEPRGLLSSIGGGASDSLGNNGGGGNNGDDAVTGNGNSNGLSFGAISSGINTGGLGDFGNGISDAEILQMSKRQKFGF